MQQNILRAALGEIPCDLVIRNIQLINVMTEEIYPAEIGIKDGMIVHVTQPEEAGIEGLTYFDGGGKFAVPGLIDTHVHIESSMMTPANFAQTVLPHGTTTVLADPHELCNVLGTEGMDYFLAASEGLPLHVMALVPSCVPSVAGLETSKEPFDAEKIGAMLAHPRVVGLAEVMDYPGVIHQSPRMTEILEEAHRRGKLIQGHCPDLAGRELSAYLTAGCESDHETRTFDEAVHKLRAGMTLECRQASNCRDMPVLAKALKHLNYPSHTTICTDDREPDNLLTEGHIDYAIRVGIEQGIPPVKAIQMATINAANFARLHDRGAIMAGRLADIILLDDLDQFCVTDVFVGGSLVAQNGAMTVSIAPRTHPAETRNTITLSKPIRKEDFLIGADGNSVRLNTIYFNPQDTFLTKLQAFDFPVKDGFASILDQDDFCSATVFERHGVNGNIASAPLHHLGLTKGAVACTVAHDCHNLFVIGKNADDMLLAAQTIVECGGGFACVIDGEVRALVELPIAGLMSTEPAIVLQEKVENLKAVLRDMGLSCPSPVNLLTAFCLAVIPEVRLTDMGLVDAIHQTIVPVQAEG